MITLHHLVARPEPILATTAWYLADLGEARGKVDMIRKVLKDLRSAGQVECLGRGQSAEWRKTNRRGNG